MNLKKYSIIFIALTALLLSNFCSEQTDAGRQGRQKRQHRRQQARGHFGNANAAHDRGHDIVELTEEEKEQVEIKTAKVTEKPIRSSLKAMGKVTASRDGKAVVSCAFSSRIIKLEASLGQWVKKGDPLVTLACEEVGNAKSAYFKASAEHKLETQNLLREERLYKKDIGAKKDYLEAKSRLGVALSQLEAAQKKLLVMGFSQKLVESLSEGKNITPYVTLQAPISGRIATNNAFIGAMVDAATEIMLILDPATLYIDAEIYEKDLAKVKLQQDVQVTVPAYPGEIFTGQVSYIGDMVNPESRTITVRTRVPNKEFKLKPGMFADIDILLNGESHALTVPLEAVLDEMNRKIVFVLEGDHYVCRGVTVGTRFNGSIEIVKGLKKGEIVVVEGNYQLRSRLLQESISHGHAH